MKTVPMIFNTLMVKALLTGHKTVTRRPLSIPKPWFVQSPQLSVGPGSHAKQTKPGLWIYQDLGSGQRISKLIPAPCATGDLIWVRETFATLHGNPNHAPISPSETSCQEVRYKASEPPALVNTPDYEIRGYKWRPSIHMPIHCSRLTLRVTEVRIETLSDLQTNPTQLQREGFQTWPMFYQTWHAIYNGSTLDDLVWVVEFEVIKKNITKIIASPIQA